jgi:hypothetical protein
MEKNKTIILTDKSFYRELYYNGGQLWYKAFFVGSVRHGYYECYYLGLKSKGKHYYAI